MNLTWVNGKYLEDEKACLHVSDLAIQRGYGVFDFFAVTRPVPFFLKTADSQPGKPGKPFLLSSYLDRFFHSARGLNLEVPVSREELNRIIDEFIVKNNLKKHGIKLTLTGGYSEDGYQPVAPNMIIRAHELKIPTKEKYQQGFRVMTHEYQRSTPGYKSLDYRHAIALIPTLKERGLDDVLYCYHGIITEFPRSNFFMVDQNDRIVTPASHILEGITRKAVLRVARDHFEVQERDVFVDELINAKETFLTSSTKSIMPVTQIDGHNIGDGPGKITRKLSELLFELADDFEF